MVKVVSEVTLRCACKFKSCSLIMYSYSTPLNYELHLYVSVGMRKNIRQLVGHSCTLWNRRTELVPIRQCTHHFFQAIEKVMSILCWPPSWVSIGQSERHHERCVDLCKKDGGEGSEASDDHGAADGAGSALELDM